MAILAPTTILVQQHYNTIKKRFAGFPVKFDMLSRFRTPRSSAKSSASCARGGGLDLVVGTHRLLNRTCSSRTWGIAHRGQGGTALASVTRSIQHMKTRVDVLTLSATPIRARYI